MVKTANAETVVEQQILHGTIKGEKDYGFDETHDPRQPVEFWFQESEEGPILFVVFYSLACRWSRCLGCNLPAKMSQKPIDFRKLMAQVDWLFGQPAVRERAGSLRKVIVSNNGSVLDEKTFSSSALIYLVAKLNLHFHHLEIMCIETRVEYVDLPELEFLARALAEGDRQTQLELAIGFEAYDDHIRNEVFHKGLRLEQFEKLCRMVAGYGFHLKCYFMQKPVPGMQDDEAVEDIQKAIDYLSRMAELHRVKINMHLNPTYAAFGTSLERSFKQNEYTPPLLADVARAALHAEGKPISVFLGLSDEGLACEGGSFLRPGEECLIQKLETFNRSRDFNLLREVANHSDRFHPHQGGRPAL